MDMQSRIELELRGKEAAAVNKSTNFALKP
jgi:hypothetical protein